MKARRVDTTQRTIVFRFTIEEISGFLTKLLYAVAYVPPLAHTRVLGGFSVALRSQGRSLSVLLPFSFPDRHSAKRDGGLLLLFPRGDRPPGSQPSGMSKIKCSAHPRAEHSELYQNRRARIKRQQRISLPEVARSGVCNPPKSQTPLAQRGGIWCHTTILTRVGMFEKRSKFFALS